jgi:RNA polymerase-binding protein DksA
MAFSKKQLSELTRSLDQRREALLEEVRDELEKTENTQYIELIDRSPADEGDQAVGDALADLNLAIIDRHIVEIRDIEAAKARVKEGTFGVCADCGDEIAFERLGAYPTAKRCLRCQAQREKTYAHERMSTL